MMDVDESIRRFLKGDEEAFTWLVREWEGRVFNFSWRILGNREDAQDAVQDTFVSVFRNLGKLRDHKSFPTWLYRIALNHCRARWRSRTPEVQMEETTGDAEANEARGQAPGHAPDDAGRLLETRDLIRKALLGLSEEHRTAIVLKEYVGLSLEELSEVMECPLSTAKSRLYHGLKGVQRNLVRLGVAKAPTG